MPAPSMPPEHRDPDGIAPAAAYRPSETVWIWRRSQWRPGIVLDGSTLAVMVRYNPHGRAVGVDTALAADLAHRHEPAPVLDQLSPG